MNYYIIKLKNQDLFFNHDSHFGDYISDIPILLIKEEADNIIENLHIGWIKPDNQEEVNYHKNDFEIKKVSIKYETT